MSDLVPPRRYPTLDLLRVIAITLTMLMHTPRLVYRLHLGPIHGGMWLGVDLFMLVSGWLLGGQLLRDELSGRFEPLRFYVKRWMRTLPPYYFILLVAFVPDGMKAGTLLSHALFLQVYMGDNWYLVSWSLCVEEHFYLLLPLIVLILKKWRRVAVLVSIVLGVEAIAVVSRYFAFAPGYAVPEITHMRWHGLFVGLAFAWVQIHRPTLWSSLGRFATWLAPVGVIATLLIMLSIHNHTSFWLFVLAPTVGTWTLALAFLPCVHEASPLSRVSFRGLQYAGELTYAIYLTHDIFPRNIVDWGGGAGSAVGAVWRIGIVLTASVLLHHLIERPALWLRQRVLKKWASKREPPVAAG